MKRRYSILLVVAVMAWLLAGSTALAAAAAGGSAQAQATQPLYPQATRTAPKLDLTRRSDVERINQGIKAANAGEVKKARAILTPFAQGKASTSQYAQVLALQALANLAYTSGHTATAITRLKRALAIGVMPNDTYFGLMYELAQLYAANGENQQALTTLHTWRSQGKRVTADSWGLEGVVDYQLNQYKAAIAAIKKAKSLTATPQPEWSRVLAASYAKSGQSAAAIALARKQVAAHPDDADVRNNLVVLLTQSGQDAQALQVLEQAREAGHLATAQGYTNLAKLYLMTARNSGADARPNASKAIAVLKAGLDKKILKPDYAFYQLMGNAALVGGLSNRALAAYTSAAKLGHDGSAELMRAQLLAQAHQYTPARAAARKALAKGTAHAGQAYMLIARSEQELGHRDAALKAMQEAAKDPATHAAAEAWLRKAGH